MPVRDASPLGAPCWVDLSTAEPDRAREFYSQLFGWTFEEAEVGGDTYVNCYQGGSRVAGIIGNTEDSGFPDGWITYFSSADAQATADLADESGGQASMPPTEVGPSGTVAVLEDPGGAAVGVWQAGEHTGFQLVGEPGSPVWHELHTRNFRASVLFYETVFGWTTSVQGDTDEFRYSTADFDGVALAGIMDATAFTGEDTQASWQVYFGVDDVDRVLALAETLGGTVIDGADDSPYGRLATIADPGGVRFKVMTPPSE